jgi:hypothetical protein
VIGNHPPIIARRQGRGPGDPLRGPAGVVTPSHIGLISDNPLD